MSRAGDIEAGNYLGGRGFAAPIADTGESGASSTSNRSGLAGCVTFQIPLRLVRVSVTWLSF